MPHILTSFIPSLPLPSGPKRKPFPKYSRNTPNTPATPCSSQRARLSNPMPTESNTTSHPDPRRPRETNFNSETVDISGHFPPLRHRPCPSAPNKSQKTWHLLSFPPPPIGSGPSISTNSLKMRALRQSTKFPLRSALPAPLTKILKIRAPSGSKRQKWAKIPPFLSPKCTAFVLPLLPSPSLMS